MWAAGATMLSLLTGRSVHEASSAQEQMVLAATRPAASLASLDPALPPAVVAVVDRALQFEQGKRWQSAAEMRDAVREAARAVPGDPITPAMLGALAAEAGPGVSASSPSDPLAPTLAAPSGSGSGGSAGSASGAAKARVTPGPAVSPPATSLVGTASQTTTAATGHARMVGGAMVLVLAGAGVGAWLATRSGAPRGEPAASASASGSASASPSALPSASESASPSASDIGSASAVPLASSAPSATPRPRPGRLTAPVSTTAKPAPDRFDRQ